MKQKRHAKIFELIREHSIGTQDELQSLLKKSGFNITQATVSRDIKELRLSKTLDANGNYLYRIPHSSLGSEDEKLTSIFRQSVLSIASCGNLVVIKCLTGMGNAACAALDAMDMREIVGTIAGDDTIFTAVHGEDEAVALRDRLNAILES